MRDQLFAELHEKVYPVISGGSPEGDSVVFFILFVVGISACVALFSRPKK